MLDAFDLVVPTMASASILLCSLAPFYMPRVFITFLFCYFCLFGLMTFNQFFQYIASVRRIVGNIRRNAVENDIVPKGEEKSGTADTALMEEGGRNGSFVANVHVFVIPNYSEPLPILQKTLEKLAAHRSSSSHYVAVLAMEATEVNSREKAESLKLEFAGSFRDIITTVHPANTPGEAQGKGSNGTILAP